MSSVIITGAGSGLGEQLAYGFARLGYHIILLGRNPNKLDAVKKQILQNNGKANSFILDITNNTATKNLLDELAATHSISILINNAGIGHFGPFEQLTDNQMKEMIDTNVIGTIQVTQARPPTEVAQIILEHYEKENEIIIESVK